MILTKKAQDQELFGTSMIILIILVVVAIGVIVVFKTNLFSGLHILT